METIADVVRVFLDPLNLAAVVATVAMVAFVLRTKRRQDKQCRAARNELKDWKEMTIGQKGMLIFFGMLVAFSFASPFMFFGLKGGALIYRNCLILTAFSFFTIFGWWKWRPQDFKQLPKQLPKSV